MITEHSVLGSTVLLVARRCEGLPLADGGLIYTAPHPGQIGK